MLFQSMGQKIDLAISWLLQFQDNDLQILLWSGLVGALLVFLIEYLRKPKIQISYLNSAIDFNLPSLKNNKKFLQSKIWKLDIAHKKSLFNRLLFRYSLNNLKVKFIVYKKDCQKIAEFNGKADSNPNIYKEWHVPFALAGINLTKNENDLFPFICFDIENLKWILFDAWGIFLSLKNREEKQIKNGLYYLSIVVSSDQASQKKWFRLNLINENCNIIGVKLIERIKLLINI